jgi:FAD/FMN-containing dehydrogenase
MTRRQFILGGSSLVAAGTGALLWRGRLDRPANPLAVNDMHSKLNATRVARVENPRSMEDLISLVKRARRSGEVLCPSGARHAMGGQQFAAGGTLVDTRGLKQVLDFDPERGLVDVEAGITWPTLVDALHSMQEGRRETWTIPMKQTGADELTLAGALAANAHGRTLTRPPFIADVESFRLVSAEGEPLRCSRTENPELFSLVAGGYGLFGFIHSVTLRLARREKLERIVELVRLPELMKRFDERVAEGFTSGDMQFAVDSEAPNFLSEGVFACYRPVPPDTPIPKGQKKVSDRAWNELVYLAHTDKSKAFQLYSDYYLGTSGQVYWSDTSQLGGYAQDYHDVLDRRMGAEHPGTEMITELYVPRTKIADFMSAAAETVRYRGSSVIYGTIRLIAQDTESFLPWAKQDYACVIFNLHVDHTDEHIEHTAGTFRRLIDLASERGGSYYLTYHRWAERRQVEACYPRFAEFLQKKLQYDPGEVFQSDWYRHYRKMFEIA